MIQKKHQYERGVVSIFVVIFTALLVTIVTVSFVQVMLRNQQASNVADISQSAYDSALAGVEDAKRVLAAGQLKNGQSCNSIKQSLGAPATDMSETKIQQVINKDNGFEQAYTCVKVDTEPKELVVDLDDADTKSASTMLPLTTVNGERFTTIEISWSLPVSNDDQDAAETTLPEGSPKLVRGGEQWGIRTPALMRAQLIQYDDSFALSDMDSSDSGPSDNARTKFLYPVAFSSAVATYPFGNDSAPTAVNCVNDGAVCSVKLIFAPQYKKNVFLRLSALYNSAKVTIRAYSDPSQPVKFAGIQAVVDSTGRAGDAFRRVSARVNLKANDTFPYPAAALELEGNLCKTFGVTNKTEDYSAGTCKPGSDDVTVPPTTP